MVESILAILSTLAIFLKKWFIKSPEEIANEKVQKAKDHSDELDKALETAKKTKDPADLSRIINS